MDVSGAVGRAEPSHPCTRPGVFVFISPHVLLSERAKDTDVDCLNHASAILVEWSPHADPGYRAFITGLRPPVEQIEVDIPDFGHKLDYVGRTGDRSCFDPYERQKAERILQYAVENRDKPLGLILGEGPWKFTKGLFDKHQIRYRVVLDVPLL